MHYRTGLVEQIEEIEEGLGRSSETELAKRNRSQPSFLGLDDVGPDAIWVDITPVLDAKKLERLSLDTPVVLLSKWRRIGPVTLLFALVELDQGPISSARFVTVRFASCERKLAMSK